MTGEKGCTVPCFECPHEDCICRDQRYTVWEREFYTNSAAMMYFPSRKTATIKGRDRDHKVKE